MKPRTPSQGERDHLISSTESFDENTTLVISGFKSRDDVIKLRQNNGIFKFNDRYNNAWVGTDLSEIDLQNSDLQNAHMADVNFRRADLRNSNLKKSILLGANFDEADLENADFDEANCAGVNFGTANLQYARFFGANLYNANLSEAILEKASFYGAHFFPEKDFSKRVREILDNYYKVYRYNSNMYYLKKPMAEDLIRKIRNLDSHEEKMEILEYVKNHPLFSSYREDESLFHIYGAFPTLNLSREHAERTANFRRRILDDKLYERDVVYHGEDEHGTYADLWWMNLIHADFRGANLQGVNFRGSDLGWANFSPMTYGVEAHGNARIVACNLRGAKFNHAILTNARMMDARLEGAQLANANLRWANLFSANLSGANLKNANLRDTNLVGANLKGANLTGAQMKGASFFPSGEELTEINLKRYLDYYHDLYVDNVMDPNIKFLRRKMRRDLFAKISDVYNSRGLADADKLMAIAINHPYFAEHRKPVVLGRKKTKSTHSRKFLKEGRKAMREHLEGVVNTPGQENNHEAYANWALTADLPKLDGERLLTVLEHFGKGDDNMTPVVISLTATAIAMMDKKNLRDQLLNMREFSGDTPINLQKADLSGLDLHDLDLSTVNLRNANLKDTDLSGTTFFPQQSLEAMLLEDLDRYYHLYAKSNNLPILQRAMAEDLINKIRNVEPVKKKLKLLDKAIKHPLFASYPAEKSLLVAYKNLKPKPSIFQEDIDKRTKAAIRHIGKCYAENRIVEYHGKEDAGWKAAELWWMDLKGADFRGATMRCINFSGSDLRGADFSPDEVQVAIVNNGVFQYAKLQHANFSQAQMIGAELDHANLSLARLDDASMLRASMQHADLSYASLEGTKLTNANLKGCILRGAKLVNANLRNADLKNADLRGAKLDGVDLRGATLDGAKFDGASFFPNAKDLTEESLALYLDYYKKLYISPDGNINENLRVLRKLMRRELFSKIEQINNAVGFVAANQLLNIAEQHPYFSTHRKIRGVFSGLTFAQQFFREARNEFYQELRERIRKNPRNISDQDYANWALVSDINKLNKDKLGNAIAYASDPESGFTNEMRRALNAIYQLRFGLRQKDLTESLPIGSAENSFPVNLQFANLRYYDLDGKNLSNAYLKHADLSGANLQGVNFRGAIIEGANFKLAEFFPKKLTAENLKELLDAYHDMYIKDGIDPNIRKLRGHMRRDLIRKVIELYNGGINYQLTDKLLALAENHPFFSTNLKYPGKRSVSQKIIAKVRNKLYQHLRKTRDMTVYVRTAMFHDIRKLSANKIAVTLTEVGMHGKLTAMEELNLRAAGLAKEGKQRALSSLLKQRQVLGNEMQQLNLQGANLVNCDLKGLNLRYVNLANAKVKAENLEGAVFLRDDIKTDNIQSALNEVEGKYAKSSNLRIIRQAVLNDLLKKIEAEPDKKQRVKMLEKAEKHPLFGGRRKSSSHPLAGIRSLFAEKPTDCQKAIKHAIELNKTKPAKHRRRE